MAVLGKIFGGMAPESSFGRQQRLSEITIGGWARFGGPVPPGPNVEPPLVTTEKQRIIYEEQCRLQTIGRLMTMVTEKYGTTIKITNKAFCVAKRPFCGAVAPLYTYVAISTSSVR